MDYPLSKWSDVVSFLFFFFCLDWYFSAMGVLGVLKYSVGLTLGTLCALDIFFLFGFYFFPKF